MPKEEKVAEGSSVILAIGTTSYRKERFPAERIRRGPKGILTGNGTAGLRADLGVQEGREEKVRQALCLFRGEAERGLKGKPSVVSALMEKELPVDICNVLVNRDRRGTCNFKDLT